MGYCTDVSAEIKVTNPNKVKNIIKDKFDSPFENVYVENDYLIIDLRNDKYCESEWYELNDELAPYIPKGIIEFKGEDGYEWGIYFENGEWEEYEPIKITPNILNMQTFKRLKQKIKNWEINLTKGDD